MSLTRISGMVALAALLLSAPSLVGCGKKPMAVDPPENAGPEARKFPHRYPRERDEPGAGHAGPPETARTPTALGLGATGTLAPGPGAPWPQGGTPGNLALPTSRLGAGATTAPQTWDPTGR